MKFKVEKETGSSNLMLEDDNSFSTIGLSQFLEQQVEAIQNKDIEISVPVEFKNKDRNNDSVKSKFYIVKTMKVKWKDCIDSFIHVFVNTTTIKKFETEKARNEWLQLMFSCVSHEFRTPINAFMNSIQFLESNYQTMVTKLYSWVDNKLAKEVLSRHVKESNDKFFKIWKISTTNLMWLVEDILDLAKIEAGTFSLNEQSFWIGSLIKEIQYIFEFQCIQKGIAFKIYSSDELLASSFCSDVGRIKQVLINLISNAFKFTIQGNIELHIDFETVFDSSSFERHKYLKFKVSDTGIGIHEKEVPKLFKLFGMVNQHSNNINSRGTGLGLSISKKIVESLGGSIDLKSQLHKGTTAEFSIKEIVKMINSENSQCKYN